MPQNSINFFILQRKETEKKEIESFFLRLSHDIKITTKAISGSKFTITIVLLKVFLPFEMG